MDRPVILLVEDEPILAQLMIDYLHSSGMAAHHLDRGDGVIDWVRANEPDLILLDLNLPKKNGLSICRQLRQFSDVPIMMITARIDEIDRLVGLELGADDYICKPFSPREVIARIKAVLRRRPDKPGEARTSLIIDQAKHSVGYEDKWVELTNVELQLLETLMKSPERVFSRDELMDRVYADHRVVNDRTIDSHVKKLRRKLNDLVPQVQLIQSVYGVGYRFTPEQP